MGPKNDLRSHVIFDSPLKLARLLFCEEYPALGLFVVFACEVGRLPCFGGLAYFCIFVRRFGRPRGF